MNLRNSTYNDYLSGNSYMDYYNIIYGQMNSCFCKKSFFRLLNAYDDYPIDVHVNEIVMGENIKSGGFTRYVQYNPGIYRVKIYKTNDQTLIYESDISIDKNLAYTGIIAADDNDKTDISVLMIPEAKENCISGKMSSVKLTNLLLDAPETELSASDGTVWFSGINYGDVSNNVAIPYGKYNLELRNKKNKKNITKIMNVYFAPKTHYTIYIIGNINEPDIKIVIPEEGVNYLGLC